ncbi:MAG: TRAP transporter fused permease subunit, partial [Proteobacteria bacterium]|nr:TRAP transporter fused permease subunit [Pseudomonadota bacterium]
MPKVKTLTWITTIIAVYHLLYIGQVPAMMGFFLPITQHLAISASCALCLIFFLRRAKGGHLVSTDTDDDSVDSTVGNVANVPWYDFVLMAVALVGSGFVLFYHETYLDYGMFGELDTLGIVMALCLAVPFLEGIRRTTGWALPIIILTFAGATVFQNYLPGLLYGSGYGIDRLMFSAWVGEGGIFGLPLSVAGNIVIVFLIFGALMQVAGAGRWFIELALALTGWSRGGPAKAAVLSSALFGSISGSPGGNAATTGVFTIPMMKEIGYKASFAAAVEAVASTGGQILPPVMGAIAFVMAEWIEVSYTTVVIAATVPALLYFLIVFVSVHLQAVKDGIEAIPRADLPDFWPVLIRGWYYLIPISALVYCLIGLSFPPGMSAMIACAVTVPCSFLSKDRSHWLTVSNLMIAFEESVKRWTVVAAITGAVGIMIGALELSGVGIKLSNFIVELSGGNLYLALFLVGFASLIVGMGLDSIPAYITLATLMAPALIEVGVPDIAAHLFVVYWGLASFYTPPMCIVVYITIGISGSRVWETGWEAVRLGIAAFLIPFAFALNPALMLRGDLERIVLATSTAAIGAIMVASAVRGFALKNMNWAERLLMFVGGVMFIAPGIKLPAAGLGILVVVL